MTKSYEDYKYVLQDTYHIFIGAQYTIEELIDNEDIPIKLRIILERYLYTEETKDITLGDYFHDLQDKSLFFRVYKQLKTKLRVSMKEEKKGRLAKTAPPFETVTLSLEALMKMTPEEKQSKELMIQEVIISKLAMMSF
jgi:hypothetical protein